MSPNTCAPTNRSASKAVMKRLPINCVFNNGFVIFSISLVKWNATVSRICGDILPDKPAA